MRILHRLLLLTGIAVASGAYAFDPFVIKDIRVEGIQRTEAGTVFNYLPVKVGDTMTEEKTTEAIRSLYASGFFKNVKISVDGDVLVVTLEERPAIAQVNFDGIKAFKTEELEKALKQVGLAEGRFFDRSVLEQAEQELKRQYVSNGRYSTKVTTTVTTLENNRVNIKFEVVEGDPAKIRKINIIGNKIFSEKELLKQFTLRTPGLLTWYTKEDQYSKQKLSADLEKLRSYYLDRGYLEFNIDSTQVSITPDRKDVYITIGVTEGPQYTVADIKLGGELLIPESEARKLITLHSNDVFSRAKLNESSKAISDRLGDDGYAFANVNAVPDLNREKHQASFTFYVDPGRRVYIRRINISGNTKTKDEVIRREFRQAEGGWYSANKIEKSKERIKRLGYFDDDSLNVETQNVPGTTDQIDINLSVKEKPTGSIMIGAGYSTTDKIILSGGVSQQNIFGTGNHMSLQVNTSHVSNVYSLSFVNPYWTPDGISRSYSIYKRASTPSALNLGDYRTSTIGASVGFGVPISEIDAVQLGLGYESTSITTYQADVCCDVNGNLVLSDISPPQIVDYVNTFGETSTSLTGSIGWARDSRDSATWPTKGTTQGASLAVAMPGGSLRYYQMQYQYDRYFPLSSVFTFHGNAGIGYGHGYDGDPLPFFKNYYIGGPSSVRGYQASTIGPKDINENPLGGSHRLSGTAEVLFPVSLIAPNLLPDDKSVRISAFVDTGMVGENYAPGDLRVSVGIGATWTSPFGPLKVSVAKPFRSQFGDQTQVLQFTFGQQF
ncbi:MAG TPA: outer membrane protein assembly factor BamA [Burkholderiales bacterium]|nr:outer membrane protein assembly factor BamA [Burkholderiales bacterium]